MKSTPPSRQPRNTLRIPKNARGFHATNTGSPLCQETDGLPSDPKDSFPSKSVDSRLNKLPICYE